MKNKKRILIFIDWYLPGYKAGGPIQSIANLVAHFQSEADFFIVTRNTDYCETRPYENVNSDQWNQVEDGVKVYYFSANKLNRAGIRSIIRSTPHDLAYLNGIFSWNFTLLPLFELRRNHSKIVIAGRGMFASSALNVKRTKKKVFLGIARMFGLFRNIVFHATTTDEMRDIVKVIGPSAKVIVAGNLPQRIIDGPRLQRPKSAGTMQLVSIARIAPEKNLLYALKILQKAKGKILFDIYGPVYDENYWKECKEIIGSLPDSITVNYKGSIDSSLVSSCLQQYHFMFMPTSGENFGHIILQSLSCGTPVIISDQTPWRNLERQSAGWDVALKEEAKMLEVLESCVAMDQIQYRQFTDGAVALGKKYSEDPALLKQNLELLNV